MKKLLIIIFFFFILVSNSFATTYYVRSDGTGGSPTSGCSNSGSYDEADYNAGSFSGGDHIIFCNDGGTFETGMNTPSAGSSGNPIIHEVESGATITFTRASSYMLTVDQSYNVFKKGDGSQWTFTQVNTPIYVGGSSNIQGIVFDGITIGPVGNASNSSDGIRIAGASSVLITNCYFGNVTHGAISLSYFESPHSFKLAVINNIFENTYRYALVLYFASTPDESDFFIDGNTFKNHGTVANPYSSTNCGGVIELGGVENTTIRRNVFINNYASILLGTNSQDTDNIEILHNVFYGADSTCAVGGDMIGTFLWTDLYTADMNINSMRVMNNIFSETDSSTRMWLFNLSYDSNNFASSNIEANLFFDSDGTNPTRITEFANGGGTQSATWWEDNNSQWIDSSNVDNDNPDFVSAGSDFTLQAGSPAIDTGVFVATVQSKVSNTLTLGTGEARAFFSKETFGISYTGVSSDTVYDDDGYSATITAVNWDNDTITLDDATNFTAGDEITFVNYTDTPDIGAYEYISQAEQPPASISGLVLY